MFYLQVMKTINIYTKLISYLEMLPKANQQWILPSLLAQIYMSSAQKLLFRYIIVIKLKFICWVFKFLFIVSVRISCHFCLKYVGVYLGKQLKHNSWFPCCIKVSLDLIYRLVVIVIVHLLDFFKSE